MQNGILDHLPHRHRNRSGRSYLDLSVGDFVRVGGVPLSFAAETDAIPRNIDHFWITIAVGGGRMIRIALSTHSRQNAAAGFDARIRLGVIESTWTELPPSGVAAFGGLDYQKIEAAAADPVTFVSYERPELETLLIQKTSNAVFIEAWGELYLRNQPGIHQIHSRRASCSVPQDYTGRDGAIRFYFERNRTAEMLLFKYCGQP